MKIRAEEIDGLPSGTVIRGQGRDWVRIDDRPDRHISGYICDPETGEWLNWACLFLMDEEVEIVRTPQPAPQPTT